jgi:retron-type reverse transcriptase
MKKIIKNKTRNVVVSAQGKKLTLPKIRAIQKKIYMPVMLKTLSSIQGIRNRSTSIANIKDLSSEQKVKKIYPLLYKENLLIQALGNISSNKGALTPGTNSFTVDGISIRRIRHLAKKIKENKFDFKPFRRIMIAKPIKKGEKKKYRPLGIPNFEDRVVQEAIRIILEAIYEPVFNVHNYNYGFRKGKSTHEAIQTLKIKGNACSNALEGDIKAAYDTVDHDVLIELLEKRISDRRFIKFIKQGLKCGLLEQGHYADTLLGVPQGGIASPILFNIYMHEFDMFVHDKVEEFIANKNALEKRKVSGVTSGAYKRVALRISRAKNSLNKIVNQYGDYNLYPPHIKVQVKLLHAKLKADYKIRSNTPSVESFNRSVRIVYVRYADDFIILTNGGKKFCEKLKEIISSFLLNRLKMVLSNEKTKITNLRNAQAKFLGFSIYTYRSARLQKRNMSMVRTGGYQILIGIDMDRVLNKLVQKGFCREKSDHRPIAKSSMSVLTLQNIIETYNYIIRGMANYYLPMISRKADIIRVIYILEYSAYMTIAKKLSTKISRIRKRFGKPLQITIKETQMGIKLPKPITTSKTITLLSYLKVKEMVEKMQKKQAKMPTNNYDVSSDIFNPLYKINWRTLRNLNSVCCICGATENVEMHHINAIRKGKVEGFSQIMKQLNRKQIPLCKEHHIAAEKGMLADIKREDLHYVDQFLA